MNLDGREACSGQAVHIFSNFNRELTTHEFS